MTQVLNKTQKTFLESQKEYSIIKDIVEKKQAVEQDLDTDFHNLNYRATFEDEKYFYFLKVQNNFKEYEWQDDYNYNYIIRVNKENYDCSLYKLKCDIHDLKLEEYEAEKIYFEKIKKIEYTRTPNMTIEEYKNLKNIGKAIIIDGTNKKIEYGCKVIDEHGKQIYQISYLMENERKNGLAGWIVENLETGEIKHLECKTDETAEKLEDEFWKEWREEERKKKEAEAEARKEKVKIFPYWNYSKKELREMGQDVLADALEDEELFENSKFGEVIDY